jgi:hypothetical protein
MERLLKFTFILLFILLIAGCAQKSATESKSTASPTKNTELFFQSQGGGEPRSAGYWKLWNSCAPDNRAETARANGGRAAGWFLLDDLLEDPGILLGELPVENCEQAISLLQRQDLDGAQRDDDPVYQLAAQLLSAQVNMAAGAEYCPAGDQAVQAGQLLLISLGFNGQRSHVGSLVNNQDTETARVLVEQLGQYNSGQLCR